MLKSRVPEVRILQGRRFIDLSHPLVHGMPGFRMAAPDGESIEYSISVRPFLTHEESRKFYHGQCSFEVTEVKMQTSVGTYLDAPRHRYQEGKDVSAFALEDLVMRGIVVDARGLNAFDALDTKALPGMHFMAGRAVLFCFGWDSKWGTDEYRRYPHLSSSCLQVLLSSGAKLIGVDTP